MEIDPRPIKGPWKAGYSLASHSISSVFLGYNEQGHPKYETVRSEIGEALFRLKYRNDASSIAKLAKTAADFVSSKRFPVEIVVPLPPSKKRAIQPVAAVAEQLAKRLKIGYDSKGLRKLKETPELKSLVELEARKAALAGAFAATTASVRGRAVLLFDDLYRSGASMEEAANTLLKSGGAAVVYAIALTRTRINK